MPANARHRNCVLNLTSFLRLVPRQVLWEGTLFHVGTPNFIYLEREEDLQKTSGVISFFRNNSIWDPPSGYSEQGGIPWSRICGSGVLLSVDEDSETHQLPSFGGLSYPAGDRLLHSRSPPVSPFGEGPVQSAGLFFRVGKMESHSVSWGEGDALSLYFIWKRI